MQVQPVDERDSGWEDYFPRFRVYLFRGGDEPGCSWATRTDDVTDAGVDEVIAWAAEQAGSEMLYAVALVYDDRARPEGNRRGLVWLVGFDANTGKPTEEQRRWIEGMHRRRAAYRALCPPERGRSAMSEQPAPRRITFHVGRRPRSDDDLIHVFGLPYRISSPGPRAWAVYRAALEVAWERGDGVGELDLDAYDAAAELDATENESPERPGSG